MKSYCFFSVLVVVFLLGFSGMVQADLNDGLVAYYPFNENANDESGNGNDGTVNGATLTADRNGNAGRAYSFNGQNSYITVPHDSSLISTDEITLSAWIKSSDMTKNDQDIISKTESGSFSLALNETDGITESKLAFLLYVNNDYQFVYSSAHVNNQWYHVVGIYDATEMKIYVDGTLEGTLPISGPIKNNTSPLILGNESGQLNEPFDGTIDDIRIYNRALSESEIQQLYNENECQCPECPDDGFTQADIDEAINSAIQACVDDPESCGISTTGDYTQTDLDTAEQKGRQACIDDPASCGISIGVDCPTPPNQDCAATFDMITNTLHIPNFQDTYWLNFGLISWETVQFELKDVGEIE